MYIPKIFSQQDSEQLKALIANYPLAALVSVNANGLAASHIPLQLIDTTTKTTTEPENQNWKLIGHIARANPMWKDVEDQSEILAIFQGPQSYITPNWYPTKKEHGKAVPTWNYAAVHTKGTLTFMHDTQWKMNMLNSLTQQMEATEPKPWQVSDAPNDYITKLLNAIVGIEIHVNHVEGKWKLSQNQPEQNQISVIKGLSTSEKLEANATAKIMEQQSKE